MERRGADSAPRFFFERRRFGGGKLTLTISTLEENQIAFVSQWGKFYAWGHSPLSANPERARYGDNDDAEERDRNDHAP